MSEWDRLWNDYGNIKHPKWLELVKAEGDKLIAHVLALEDALLDISLHKGLVSTKYIKDEALDAAKKLEAIRKVAQDMVEDSEGFFQDYGKELLRVLGE